MSRITVLLMFLFFSPHAYTQTENESPISILRKTRFEKPVKFTNEKPEVILGNLIDQIEELSSSSLRVYFLSTVGNSGAKSFPSRRKISISYTEGVDGYTVFSGVLQKALWHWELSNDKLFIIPWQHSEDWSISN